MKRVLIIEDDAPFRRTVANSLRSAGFMPLEADTAASGIERIRTEPPDLILCDIGLGRGDGLDVLQAVRNNPATGTLQFILITASDDPSIQRRGMELGADDFLYKPFTEVELLAAVRAQKTKREALRRQAGQTNARLLALVEATGDVVAIMDHRTLEVLYLNRAGCTLTGWDLEKGGRKMRMADFYPPEAFATIQSECLPAALEHDAWVGETVMRDKAGGRVAVRQQLLARRGEDGTVEHLSLIAHDVTQRNRMEASLAQERHLFNTLMDTLPESIYFKDLESRFVKINRKLAEVLGVTSESAAGRTDADFFMSKHADEALADEREIIRSGEPLLNREERDLFKDGRTRWVSTTKLPLRDSTGRVVGTFGISRDITEQKEGEMALRESLARFQDLVEGLSDWVWETDAEARFTYSSPRAMDLLGYRPQEIIGQSLFDLMPGVERSRVGSLLREAVLAKQRLVTIENLCLHKNGNLVLLERRVVPNLDGAGRLLGYRGIDHDITQRRRMLEDLRKLSRAVEQSPASVVITNTNGKIEYVNPKFTKVTGYTPEEVLGMNPRILKSGDTLPEEYRRLWALISSGQEWRGEFRNRKKSGEMYWEYAVISPIKGENGHVTHYLAVKEDITERKRSDAEHDQMEVQLRHAQKMESIGQLAAGIAHEINTPTQYIGDNTRFLQDAFGSLDQVIVQYATLFAAAKAGPIPPVLLEQIAESARAADIDYLRHEIPQAIQQSLDGLQRVSKIVRAMKEFSHPGSEEKQPIDLNHAIESTLTVSRNEWKYVAELVTRFDADLPPVACLPGEFNQVILNLVVNAAHAIADVVGDGSQGKGTITVSTQRDGAWVEVRVGDTGRGIPEAIRNRIFEPFFTTKRVGKGTGQGLAIAHSVVVDKHGGTIHFECGETGGTCFVIRLPLAGQSPSGSDA